MKKIILFVFLLGFGLASLQAVADTCPRIEEIHPALPPVNWDFLVPPDRPTDQYRFSSAIHALGSFYYGHVICRYDTAYPSFSAFTLISFKIYQEPSEPIPPWDHGSVLQFTLTCMPGNHDPAACVFQ